MKLIVMRHFKSSWDHPGDDHDRPLNQRGQLAAHTMGDWLRAHGHIPDQALVSTASRTRESYQRLALAAPAQFYDDLYLAPARAMFTRLRSSATQPCVLVLGHNPGIADFAQQLAAAAPQHDQFHRYPTGATLVLDTDLHTKAGHVIDFCVPRDLSDPR
ncbi:MAG: histidine phosphatase family protein [Pseudomonadota bacterium]